MKLTKFIFVLLTLAVVFIKCQYFKQVSHPVKPKHLRNTKAPLPTTSWFQNLLLQEGADPIQALPFTVKMVKGGMIVNYPNNPTQLERHIIAPFIANWKVTARGSNDEFEITRHDDLSIDLEWGNRVKVPLVQGSPWLSFFFTNSIPFFETIHAITSVGSRGVPGVVSGDSFVVGLNNGQLWKIYFSKRVSLTWTRGAIILNQRETVLVRIAVLDRLEDQVVLDKYSGAVPLSAKVDLSVVGDLGDVTYTFNVMNNDPNLLMFSLLHHRETLQNPNYVNYKVTSLKGDMVGVVGQKWVLREPLTTISWNSKHKIDQNKREIIRQSLKKERFVTEYPRNTYFYGKAIARLGRLALIADELGETAEAKRFRDEIKRTLVPYITQRHVNPLLYDTVWGGVVSKDGVNDWRADFGQGYYNDHQFHYGYWAYAFAVVGKTDPTWLNQNRKFIYAIVNDYAGGFNSPLFTPHRAKDWYSGHSWANGLFTFGDNRNQESTSEAINGYYSTYLLGKVLGDRDLEDRSRIMLATEIRTTVDYWHMTSEKSVYPKPFSNHKVIGILWGSKVDYTTWFGNNPEFIHCIQMLPFTPISEEYMRYTWAKEQWPILEKAIPAATQGWRGFMYMNQAVFDKNSAWRNVMKLTDWDDGNSLTNTLYWVASRRH